MASRLDTSFSLTFGHHTTHVVNGADLGILLDKAYAWLNAFPAIVDDAIAISKAEHQRWLKECAEIDEANAKTLLVADAWRQQASPLQRLGRFLFDAKVVQIAKPPHPTSLSELQFAMNPKVEALAEELEHLDLNYASKTWSTTTDSAPFTYWLMIHSRPVPFRHP